MSQTFPPNLDATGRPLPVSVCPVCHYAFDCASSADNGQPCNAKPGDVSLCLRCGEILVFGMDMRASTATVAVLLDLQKQPHEWNLLTRAQALIRARRYEV